MSEQTKQITKVLNTILRQFAVINNNKLPVAMQTLNQGYCYMVATLAQHVLFNKFNILVNLKSHPHHCFIEFEGKYYDTLFTYGYPDEPYKIWKLKEAKCRTSYDDWDFGTCVMNNACPVFIALVESIIKHYDLDTYPKFYDEMIIDFNDPDSFRRYKCKYLYSWTRNGYRRKVKRFRRRAAELKQNSKYRQRSIADASYCRFTPYPENWAVSLEVVPYSRALRQTMCEMFDSFWDKWFDEQSQEHRPNALKGFAYDYKELPFAMPISPESVDSSPYVHIGGGGTPIGKWIFETLGTTKCISEFSIRPSTKESDEESMERRRLHAMNPFHKEADYFFPIFRGSEEGDEEAREPFFIKLETEYEHDKAFKIRDEVKDLSKFPFGSMDPLKGFEGGTYAASELGTSVTTYDKDKYMTLGSRECSSLDLKDLLLLPETDDLEEIMEMPTTDLHFGISKDRAAMAQDSHIEQAAYKLPNDQLMGRVLPVVVGGGSNVAFTAAMRNLSDGLPASAEPGILKDLLKLSSHQDEPKRLNFGDDPLEWGRQKMLEDLKNAKQDD